MKPKLFISALLLSIVQVMCFIGIWSAALSAAQALARVERSDIGFGILIAYGLILIGLLFLISSCIGTMSSKVDYRWIAVLGCLAIWSYWMIPSFGPYPFRAAFYYSIGCGILIFGCLVLAPLLRRWVTKKLPSHKRIASK